MIQKIKDVLDTQTAMDNLALVAGIEMENPPRLGIVRKYRFVTDEEEFPLGEIQWLSGEGSGAIFEVMEATYHSIRSHLLGLFENPEMDWSSEKMQKGIGALMTLVGESAEKMDRYLAFRLNQSHLPKVSEGTEYKSLHQFYTHRFFPKFGGHVQGNQAWEEEWEENEDAALTSAAGRGLKDFETVRRDQEYELFYIRNEDGKSYLNADLLRNIKLTVDFESDAGEFEEDPLLKVSAMQDRDLQASANQILGDCHSYIEDFYKLSKKFQGSQIAFDLSSALVALFLAANSIHLLQNTAGKTCNQYFHDFHAFLRSAMKRDEYQKWLAYPPEKEDRFPYVLISLAHVLCYSFFHRVGGVKQEAIGLIHRAMRRGDEEAKQKQKHLLKGETLWNQLLLDDESLRSWLAKFPNGPLFKILDLIREESDQDASVPFDPIGQSNMPSSLYKIDAKGDRLHVLRLPCPTSQGSINKAEIIDEMRGYLRHLSAQTPKKKHLFINLQDRTSWREYARCRALENLQMNAEFSSSVFVITLPKDTDFYHQTHEYLNMNKAADFISALSDQLQDPESYGYYFPPAFKKTEISRFISSVLPVIHRCFFNDKATLTRRNREDFIEIFYQLLILKAIEKLEPDSLSFTCKDAIDTGSAEVAAFYGFLTILNGNLAKKQERDFLLWLFYTPALFIRERPIDPERLGRALSLLERLDTEISHKGDQIRKSLADLYDPKWIKSIQIEV
jgi:hypothetical protein